MVNIYDMDELEDLSSLGGMPVPQNLPSVHELQLVSRKVPVKYCEYKISTTPKHMVTSETVAMSVAGLQFPILAPMTVGSLLRIWIEMPDYWARKSRHVGYRHTEAPTYFQVLARVTQNEEVNKRTHKYQVLCQILNLDPVDEVILKDYLAGTKSS